MSEYEASTYGDKIAEVYDEWYPGLDTEAAVDFLAELAGPGPALELGIGTGRVALPLVERGVEVQGIDASEAMVEKLRAKPGGDHIPVTIGNFADVDVEGEFSLVFATFSTIYSLLTQEDQVRCFKNVAGRLKAGGLFVVEAFLPDLARFDRGQRFGVSKVDLDKVLLEASRHDLIRQRVDAQQIALSENGIQFYPVNVRYAWPSELDLMARLAGLRLRDRWGGWRREPLTDSSTWHVSVYEQASA